MKNKDWISNIVSGEYVKYYEKMYGHIDEAAAGMGN